MLIISTNTLQSGKYEISTIKTSMGSVFKKMCALSAIKPNYTNFKANLEKTEAILGMPGSGKTTTLVKKFTENSMAICMTSNGL